MAASDDDILLKDLVPSSSRRGKRVIYCSEDTDEDKNEDSLSPGQTSSTFEKQCGKDDSSDNYDANDDEDDDASRDNEVISEKSEDEYVPKRRRLSSRREREFKCPNAIKKDLKMDDIQFNPEEKEGKNVSFSASHDSHITPSECKSKKLFKPSDITVFRNITERGTLYNIKVRITRLWYGMLYPKTTSPSLTFVARDEDGVEREVVTDTIDAHKWKRMISVNKIYIVKNVMKLITTKPTKVVNFTWQLSMTKQSVVREVSDLSIAAGPVYGFQKLNSVPNLARRIEYIHDILAYVVEVGNPRTFTMKRGGTCKLVDVFLIDDSCYEEPVKLTIWEDVLNKYNSRFGKGNVDGFVIIAMGMRAKIFQEKAQLETTRFTKIKFEANGVLQAQQLMRWVRSKLSAKQLSYTRDRIGNVNNNPNQIVKTCTIADLINATQSYPPIDKVLIFIVYATVTDIYADTPWFEVCAQCFRAVRVQHGRDYTCLKCGHSGSDSIKKFKVKARIEDCTDQTDIVAFDQQAEILLHRPLLDIISLYTSSGETYEYERHLDKCASVAYKIKLKVTRENHKFVQGGGGFTVYNLERIVRQFDKGLSLQAVPTGKHDSSNFASSGDRECNPDHEI